ncbi:MAG: hypothetical protein R8K49_07490, partial [Mariprofundaceae bacterium]
MFRVYLDAKHLDEQMGALSELAVEIENKHKELSENLANMTQKFDEHLQYMMVLNILLGLINSQLNSIDVQLKIRSRPTEGFSR